MLCFIAGSGAADSFAEHAGHGPIQPEPSHSCQPPRQPQHRRAEHQQQQQRLSYRQGAVCVFVTLLITWEKQALFCAVHVGD